MSNSSIVLDMESVVTTDVRFAENCRQMDIDHSVTDEMTSAADPSFSTEPPSREEIVGILSKHTGSLATYGATIDDILNLNIEDWKTLEGDMFQKMPLLEKIRVRRFFRSQICMDFLKSFEFQNQVFSMVRQICNKYDTTMERNVAKLYDAEDAIGSLVFLKDNLALTAFHSVHVDGIIKQDSLTLCGFQSLKLLHIVSYPFYDLSFYRVLGTSPHGMDLEEGFYIAKGCEVLLLSFPTLTNNEAHASPCVTHGKVAQQHFSIAELCLAQYECFANSSGGVVVSPDGRLVGLHTESAFHENTEYWELHQKFMMCSPSFAIRSLVWPAAQIDSDSDSEPFQDQNSLTLSRYAAKNCQHKGSLGVFVPVYHIKRLMLAENFIQRVRGHKRKVRTASV